MARPIPSTLPCSFLLTLELVFCYACSSKVPAWFFRLFLLDSPPPWEALIVGMFFQSFGLPDVYVGGTAPIASCSPGLAKWVPILDLKFEILLLSVFLCPFVV